MSDASTWLTSDASLFLRIAIGASIFATLAIVDIHRHGRDARRPREYAFLVACVALAIVYGVVNDLITSRISVEYFLYFKGVADRVGQDVLLDPAGHRGTLDLQAMRIGALATWTVGLLAGALMLVANSLGTAPPLPVRRLLRLVPILFACAITFAVVLGVVGYHGGLTWTSADFRQIVADDEFRPYHLMATWGVHLGGYVGGGVGVATAIALILRDRRNRLAASLLASSPSR